MTAPALRETAPLINPVDELDDDRSARSSDARASTKERWLAYLCFLVLGASVLLPWNLLIVVTPYFTLRLRGSTFSSSAATWVPLAFTFANFVCLAWATYAQGRDGFLHVKRNVYASIGAIGCIILLLLLSTHIGHIAPLAFLALMLSASVVGAAVSAVLQSGSAALAARFIQPLYMQAVMSGQGAIGFAVALAQLLAALRANHDQSALPGDGDGDEKLLQSTSSFFLTSLVFTIIAGGAAWTLFRLPLYRSNMQSTGSLQREEPVRAKGTSLKRVNGKVQGLGLAVLGIYTVTIGLFPGVTTTIVSSSPDSPISNPLLWIPIGFVVFNTADWVGRALPAFPKLLLTNKRLLVIASACRLVFLPLLLMCNIVGPGAPANTRSALISSDAAYLAILAAFALSNGYLTSLLMMRAITEPTLEDDERDVASSLMLLYLVGGLSVGALHGFILTLLVS